MIKQTIKRFASMTALLLAASAGAHAQTTPSQQPDASAMVFEAPHLKDVKAPGRLIYSFDYKTSNAQLYGENFSDTAQLNLLPGRQGQGIDLSFDMFTGERQRTHGPVVNAQANAATLFLLEWDLARMKRYIKGDATYFRNRFRQAFLNKAVVEPVKFTLDGKEIAGERITVKPYQGDPNAAQMDIFHAKTFEFTMSDDVPGGVYQIRIFVPNAAVPGPAQSFIEEKMTFARYEQGSQ